MEGVHPAAGPPHAAVDYSSLQTIVAVSTATATLPAAKLSMSSASAAAPHAVARDAVFPRELSTLAVSAAAQLGPHPLQPGLDIGAGGTLPTTEVSRHVSNRVDHGSAIVEPFEMPWAVSLPPTPSPAAVRGDSALTSPAPSARTGETYVVTELPAQPGEIDVVTTQASRQHMEVSLRTPEMGQIWLEVTEVDQRMEARLEARAEITMKLLQTALSEIRERVESIGVELDSLSLGFRQENTHDEPSAWSDRGFPVRQRRGMSASPRLVRSPVRRLVNWRGQINVLA